MTEQDWKLLGHLVASEAFVVPLEDPNDPSADESARLDAANADEDARAQGFREGVAAALAAINATKRELTDIMNVDGPLRDRVRGEMGMDGIQRAVHKVIALEKRLSILRGGTS